MPILSCSAKEEQPTFYMDFALHVVEQNHMVPMTQIHVPHRVVALSIDAHLGEASTGSGEEETNLISSSITMLS